MHWDVNQSVDSFILQHAIDWWERFRVMQFNDFQTLENLIIHNYQACVVDVWILLMRTQVFDSARIEVILSWLEKQTSESQDTWLTILRRIFSEFRASLSSARREAQSLIIDEQFNNHQNFCAHVESYLILRYAIKYVDIDLLRHALRKITVMFQSRCADTSKYAQVLLYTLHTIDSIVSVTRLQNVILMNEIVNLRDQLDSNFETDRFLKLLNNNLKSFQKERTISSKNDDELLVNWALNEFYLL
jgi:hypothetical protein